MVTSGTTSGINAFVSRYAAYSLECRRSSHFSWSSIHAEWLRFRCCRSRLAFLRTVAHRVTNSVYDTSLSSTRPPGFNLLAAPMMPSTVSTRSHHGFREPDGVMEVCLRRSAATFTTPPLVPGLAVDRPGDTVPVPGPTFLLWRTRAVGGLVSAFTSSGLHLGRKRTQRQPVLVLRRSVVNNVPVNVDVREPLAVLSQPLAVLALDVGSVVFFNQHR